jgi:hypothetical protein
LKKFLIILFLIPVLVKGNHLITNLSPKGSNTYYLSIEGDISFDEKKLRDVFQNKVNEVCGTSFEIINKKTDYINNEGSKNNILDGTFKCFVNSQM